MRAETEDLMAKPLTSRVVQALAEERDQLRRHLATARGQIVQYGVDAIALAEEAAKWRCHAKAALDACKDAETERNQFRDKLSDAQHVMVQLRADKAELLAALKDSMRGPMSVAQVKNALALIAKHGGKDAPLG